MQDNAEFQRFFELMTTGIARQVAVAVPAGASPARVGGAFDPRRRVPVVIETDVPFGQAVMSALGFPTGAGVEQQPSARVFVGSAALVRACLPEYVNWIPPGVGRPYGTLVVDCTSAQDARRDELAKHIFHGARGAMLVETALERIAEDALGAIAALRHAADRPFSVVPERPDDVLIVVSMADGKMGVPASVAAGVAERPAHVVWFATRTGGELLGFPVRQNVAQADPSLRRAYLDQIYSAHLGKLVATDSPSWRLSDAFLSETAKSAAGAFVAVCKGSPGPDELVSAARVLLGEVAQQFGASIDLSAAAKDRLAPTVLDQRHFIGADEKQRVDADFVNPHRALWLCDKANRTVGYALFCVEPNELEPLRKRLQQDNLYHNVLVVSPTPAGVRMVIYRGKAEVRGRVLGQGTEVSELSVSGLVRMLGRFFEVSRAPVKDGKELAIELAARAKTLRVIAKRALDSAQRPFLELKAAVDKALSLQSPDEFCDTYAQTVTYGMLAARWLSRDRDVMLTAEGAGDALPPTSPFLKDFFKQLTNLNIDDRFKWLVDDIASLLARTPVNEVFGKDDPAIHFYEVFLEAYDRKKRNDLGVYYTPDQVVDYIVRSANTALKEQFGLPLGLADLGTWVQVCKRTGAPVPKDLDAETPFVHVLDPATGTGTFVLHVIRQMRTELEQHWAATNVPVGERAALWDTFIHGALPRIGAFELGMAPYVVAHLRVGLLLDELAGEGGFVFREGERLGIYLTNTLQPTDANPVLIGTVGAIAKEGQAADAWKRKLPVTVIVGNPPYDRLQGASEDELEAGLQGKAGWLLKGDVAFSGRNSGPMQDWLEAASNAGRGGDIHNMYNLYVYFWRYSFWRVFERAASAGVCALVTPSSFLVGPGFVGMRESFRRVSSALRVLDLGGDQRGTRVSANVFPIKTAVCVLTVVSRALSTGPEAGRYQRLEGTREEKLVACSSVDGARGWQPLFAAPQAVLLGKNDGIYFEIPEISTILPLSNCGCKVGRTWPIAAAAATLAARWRDLVEASPLSVDAKSPSPRTARFKDSPTGQQSHRKCRALPPASGTLRPILELTNTELCSEIVPYSYRSFDRQRLIRDARLLDRASPELWAANGPKQVHLTSLLTKQLGDGAGAVVTSAVPDMDYFCNRGGRDVIPLWRDAAGTDPNVNPVARKRLAAIVGTKLTDDALFLYTAAVLGSPAYTERFFRELVVPGPRLPIPRNAALFAKGVALGKRVVCLHTFGERYAPAGFVLSGTARVVTAVSDAAADYPDKLCHYDEKSQTIRLGTGIIGPVPPEIGNFSVSGFRVVKSWLDYRSKTGAGKSSSPLDDIRPTRWTHDMTEELLRMLWVLEGVVALFPEQAAFLDEVMANSLVLADELGEARKADAKADSAPPPGLFAASMLSTVVKE